jgi:nicotinamide-nucleotide amidase
MRAEIVMTGTELLLGEIIDTNAARLAKGLRGIGMDLYYKTTVGDNEARITEVLDQALNRAEVIITSGGLGPTVDDVTRQAVANATGRQLVYSHELERQIEARFRSFGREMSENNKRQAWLPEGATPLLNPVGTAPCFLSEDVNGRGCVISLPGVPRELEYMLDNVVLPLLIERMGGAKVMQVRLLRTCAVGESNIDRAIGDLMMSANPTVGLSAHAGQTDIRLTAKADTEAEAEALLAPMEAELRRRLGVAIYGVGEETVPQVVGRLLTEQGVQVGVMDTLTGGQLVESLREAGFGDCLSAALHPASIDEVFTAAGIRPEHSGAPEVLASTLAEVVKPIDGLGLTLLGPVEQNTTVIAVSGPNGVAQAEQGRRFEDSEYARRWFVIHGLDAIRRALLGQLTSPVDWQK